MRSFEFREQLAGNHIGNLAESLHGMIETIKAMEDLLAECEEAFDTDMSMLTLMVARTAMEEVHLAFTQAVQEMVKKLPELLAQHPLPVMQQLGECITVGHYGPLFTPLAIHVEGGA